MSNVQVTRSITRLIRALEEGQGSAVGPLLEAYFDRLVQLARKRLGGLPGLASYDEDVALRSFQSICQGLRNPDRKHPVRNRDELWRLLATRTVSRAIDQMRKHHAEESPGAFDVELLLAREPSPEDAAAMADECHRLLERLDDSELRQIALWKAEGETNEEIALRLNCVTRTIERKVSRIRVLWRHELKELDA